MQYPTSFVIAEPSQVGQARRDAVALAASLGFEETKQGSIALIATELANNLIRHASHGELHIRAVESNGVIGIELTSVDSGPGMANIGQCMRDGYSTAGTAGNGLGAIARLSDRFDVYSVSGEGTALVSLVWQKPVPAGSPAPMEYGLISRPKPGQEVCGDSAAVEHRPERSLYFVADGLGHGPDAAIASQEAVRAFRKHAAQRPKEIMEAVHRALHGTRGVAAAVAEIHFNKREVCFAGVGNIAGTIASSGSTQSMVSHNGIVGHQVRKIQEFVYPWTPESLIVMHSDGLSSRWTLDRYAGLIVRHPSVIAGILYRDFQRQTDDATALVGRMTREL